MSLRPSSRRKQRKEALKQGNSFYSHDSHGLRCSNSEESKVPLSWRTDPKVSGADWTIHVVSGEQTASYQVHRNFICFGKRSSKYFARIMSDANIPSNVTTRKKRGSAPACKVDLEPRDAANFPIVLDFLYGDAYKAATGTMLTASLSMDHSIGLQSILTSPTIDDDQSLLTCSVEELDSDNVVSIRYLARKFEIESLLIVTNRFIQRDLTVENCVAYIKEATKYDDRRLYESAKKLWIENFDLVPKRNVPLLPISTFKDLIISLGPKGEEDEMDSKYISDIVCRYFEQNPKALNATDLLELTDVSRVPYIATEAAISMTALIKYLSDSDAEKYWDELVQLSRRCARPVVHDYGWSDFSVEAAVQEYLGGARSSKGGGQPRIESLLFATSFAAALQQAQDDYGRLQEEQTSIEDTVRLLGASVKIMERINDRKDEQLARQQRAIDEAQKQIAILRNELQQLREFPVVETRNTMETVSGLYPSASGATDTLASSTMMTEDEEPIRYKSPLRDLISPCQIGFGVPQMKNVARNELRTRAEMRTKSLMS